MKIVKCPVRGVDKSTGQIYDCELAYGHPDRHIMGCRSFGGVQWEDGSETVKA